MPVFALDNNSLDFPDPAYAEPDGLLAIGGDLSVARLVKAYSYGIFPWYSAEHPILWWTPDPRCVLFLKDFHKPRSLRRTIRRELFKTTIDTAFEEVINACARDRGEGTWLVDEMIAAYIELHKEGIAHSVESWKDGELVGGLYGVSLGRVFFGESMFYKSPDASKVALVRLVQLAKKLNFAFIDCQQETEHLLRFGARAIKREKFMNILTENLNYASFKNSWSQYISYLE